MSNKKELLKINSNFLENIHNLYLTDIEEIQQYYPKHIKDKLDNLDDDVKIEILKTGKRMTSGIKSSIPMKCKGSKCCLSSVCSLFKNNLAPIDYPCPYEEFMVDKLTAEYYISLEIDPFNRVERDQVKQMVELMIIDNRASADISDKGLYTMQVVGATNKGLPIYNEVESLAYNIKIKTQTRIEKIQQELLATRKIKKQMEIGKNDDPSSRASNLVEKYKQLYKDKEIEDVNVEVVNESKENTEQQ